MKEKSKATDTDHPPVNNEDKLYFSNKNPSTIEVFFIKITLLWGRFFRFSFILAIGIFAYLWFEPKSLGDVPFSQLTGNMIGRNLFGALIPLGCIFWFFNFPELPQDEMSPGNPYKLWASSSLLGAVIAGLFWYYIIRK